MEVEPSTPPPIIRNPALRAVEGNLRDLRAKLESVRREKRPVVAKLEHNLRNAYEELIVEARKESGGQLSVAGQTFIEQNLAKVEGAMNQVSVSHRAAHKSVSATGKAIERRFVNAYVGLFKNQKNLEKSPELKKYANILIIDYLMSSGHIKVAEKLCEEAGLQERLREYMAKKEGIADVMTKLKQKDVLPAQEWIENHDPENVKLISDLQKLHIIKLLQEGKRIEAILYARTLSNIENDIEFGQLMGAVFASEKVERYQKAYNDTIWLILERKVAHEFAQTSSQLGPLLRVGRRAVPSLMNIRAKVPHRQDFFLSGDELPIEIPLPSYVHSTFTCPILRQQSTDANPPMRLHCGHVISRDAMNKLAQAGRYRSGTRLRCPYCPKESTPLEAKRVIF